MPFDEFLSGTDWQVSSDPVVYRTAHIDDVWPEGAGAGKDDLAPGHHPIFAIGPKAQRAWNVVGVVTTYDTLTDLVVLNVAPGAIVMAYIANVTTYSQGVPAAWAAVLDKHVPVFVDDSVALAAGVTLSLSVINSAGLTNPKAGYTWPDQDEWDDSGVGGGNSDPYPKAFALADDEAYLESAVMLWPDSY